MLSLPNRQKHATRNRPAMTRLTRSLLILTPLLSGCASVQGPLNLGPVLSSPPPAVYDVLTAAAKKDASVAAWYIDLDNYYRKLGR